MGCAASPSSVTRPRLQDGSGSASNSAHRRQSERTFERAKEMRREAGEPAHQSVAIDGRAPILLLPVLVDNGDYGHLAPGAHGIVDDMGLGCKPDAGCRDVQRARHGSSVEHGACGGLAGECEWRCLEMRLAQPRKLSIGGYQRSALRHLTCLTLHTNAGAAFLNA